jgi:hypothetical protein
MTQQEMLMAADLNQQLWATYKYDELLQVVLQNKILVERGLCKKLFCDSCDTEMVLYNYYRGHLIMSHKVNEDELRGTVIELVSKRY